MRRKSRTLLKWYEPVEYGQSVSASPLFDRLFPFIMSLMVAIFFTQEFAGKAPPFTLLHLAAFLVLLIGVGVLFSIIFPYLFREEVRLSKEGITRTAGRMPPRFTAYRRIERCELLPSEQYTLMKIELRGAHDPSGPTPVRETALPKRIDLNRVRAIIEAASVPVVFKPESKNGSPLNF